MNKFKVGQKVALLESNLEGEVLGYEGTKVLILDPDGFESSFFEYQLVVKFEEEVMIELKDNEKILVVKPLHKESIDLHIQEYHLKKYKIPRSQALTKQLNILSEAIEDAIKDKVDILEIIHGKGDGILKNEVLKLLESKNGIVKEHLKNKGITEFWLKEPLVKLKK